jgi:peptide/nickel transport system permease protein
LTGYLLRRASLAVPLLLGAATVVFFLVSLIPGDPAQAMLGPSARSSEIALLRHDLGLDEPIAVRYAHFLGRLARCDLGRSYHDRDPVASLLLERLPLTACLAGATLLLALLAGVPLGLAAGLRPGGSLDRGSRLLAAASLAVPSFWLGPLLILLFSIRLRWLPVSGADVWEAVVLPASTLAVPIAALVARLLAAGIGEETTQAYVVSARARGLERSGAVLKHAVRNAASPALQALGLQLGSLLTGAVITETIFAWPGLGRLLVRGIATRDYPVVQGAVLLFAAIYVGANLLCDAGRAALDPRTALQ